MKTIVLTIRTLDTDKVTDSLNETLNELVLDGAVDDTNDGGWVYRDENGNLLGE